MQHLFDSLIYYLKQFCNKNSKDKNTDINKHLLSLIEILKRQPSVFENLNAEKLEEVNDYFHKVIYELFTSKFIAKQVPELREKDSEMLHSFLNFYLVLSQYPIPTSIIINDGVILEIIMFCLKFDHKNDKGKVNDLSVLSYQILQNSIILAERSKDDPEFKKTLKNSFASMKEMLLNIFDLQFYKLLINTSKPSNSINTTEAETFLKNLKSEIKNPEFIWDNLLRKELLLRIFNILTKINNSQSVNFLEEMKNFQYESYKNELKINNVYVKLYNLNPTWEFKEPNEILEALKDRIIQSDDYTVIHQLLLALSNVIVNSKASELQLIKDEKFVQKFYSLLKLDRNEVSKEVMDTVVPACLNLLVIFSSKSSSVKFVLNHSTFFILICIIDQNNSKQFLEPVVKILSTISKSHEVNLSILLFLLKKVIMLKSVINKVNKDEVNSLRIEILKTIRKFISNEKIGSTIKSLFEQYLPSKIIENLFGGKTMGDINLSWIDSDLELPDLIWNSDAINQSVKLLEEDCQFILNDEHNLDNFPDNYFSHRFSRHKTFFFEISDEFRVDNIYLRNYNKDPSYNMGKSLFIFVKQILKLSLETLEHLALLKFYEDNINKDDHAALAELLKTKLVTCLIAICLIIEQVNFNDFNDNLGIASEEEMKNIIKDEGEKKLVNLIQRSFNYQKILQESTINKILSIGKVIFGLDKSMSTSFDHFDNNVTLSYLEIVYLLTMNKHAIQLVADSFDVITILDKFYTNQEKIGDCKC